MDEMYGVDSYSEKALMSPENLMIPEEYNQYHYHSLTAPMFGSDELGLQYCSVESASVSVHNHDHDHDHKDSTLIKAKISSHPSYSKLLDAYIDCQKVSSTQQYICGFN